jgi:hypothetical protein
MRMETRSPFRSRRAVRSTSFRLGCITTVRSCPHFPPLYFLSLTICISFSRNRFVICITRLSHTLRCTCRLLPCLEPLSHLPLYSAILGRPICLQARTFPQRLAAGRFCAIQCRCVSIRPPAFFHTSHPCFRCTCLHGPTVSPPAKLVCHLLLSL